MATPSQAIDSMINRFLNNLPTVDGVPLSANVVKTPNAPFKTPQDQPWIRLNVFVTEGVNVEPGGKTARTRYDGILTIDIFVPTGTGNKITNEIQTQIKDLYARVQFEDMRSKTVVPNILGRNEVDSNWYLTQVDVNFEFDDCE